MAESVKQSQLTDIWNKAQEKPVEKTESISKKEIKGIEVKTTKATRKTAISKPVEFGTGEIRESKAFKRLVNQIESQGEAEYKAMELAENRLRAKEFVDQDFDFAYKVAKGLESPPEGMTLSTLTDEVFNRLVEQGREVEATRIARRLTLLGTRYGQEIKSFDEIYDNNSAQKYVNMLLKERMRKKINYKFENGKAKPNGEIRERAKRVKTEVDLKASKVKNAQDIINSILCR
jgi:hypothetical protein